MEHALVENPPNGYERDINSRTGYRKINNNGGDEIDYLYEDGKVVGTTTNIETQKIWTEFGHEYVDDGYGVRYDNQGGGLIDLTGEITSLLDMVS